MRAAQQLIAAEHNQICARAQAFTHNRFLRHSEAGEVIKAAAADVINHGELMGVTELYKLGDRHGFAKPTHSVVARMHAEQRRSRRADCFRIIG